jgi:2Fe-2S ferredoxin
MGIIFVKDREGNSHILEAEAGSTIMEIIRDAGLEIEAACGGCCACATCHVYVEENWLSKLKTRCEEEILMLDQAFHIANTSRLCCQLEFDEQINGIVLTLAPD